MKLMLNVESKRCHQCRAAENSHDRSSRHPEIHITGRGGGTGKSENPFHSNRFNLQYRQSKMYHYYLGEYIRSLGKEDMLFTDITEEFGTNFILYLKTNYPHKPSYRNHCLCWLKRLVYLAVDKGILRYNPLDDIKYEKKAPTKLMYISKNQLQEIISHPKPDPLQELARRTFIFHVFVVWLTLMYAISIRII